MDLRQLRNAIAVLEHGSIGKAAEALSISQPALTKSIHRLEKELQVSLFFRNALGTHPTVFGECLRAHAEAVTVGISDALAEIEALRTGTSGIVRVGVPKSVAHSIMPEAVMRVIRDRPDLRVNISTFQLDPTPGLLAGKFDFTINIVESFDSNQDTCRQLLFEDHLAIVASQRHQLSGRRKVTLDELQPYKWILPQQGSVHRVRLERLFESLALAPPKVVIEYDTAGFTTQALLQSAYLGIIPSVVLDGSYASAGIVEVNIERSPLLARRMALVWRKRQVLPPAAKLLMEELLKICEERGLRPRS